MCNRLAVEERAGCFTLPSCCHMAISVLCLSYGAVGWSTVCDCGISWSNLLFFSKTPVAHNNDNDMLKLPVQYLVQ